ncbi:hypothetical protein QQG55_10855 [Brugia pahangi]
MYVFTLTYLLTGLGDKSSCKTFLHGRLFLQVEILACTAAIVWVLAMIFDPIINFFADPNFIDSIRSWFSCIKFQIPPLQLLFLHKSNSNS